MSHRESIGSAPRFSTRCIVPEATPPSERTRVVREPNRGVYDRETIYKILDEGFVCHVGFSVDGQPYVIPTLFARVGHALYFHGSPPAVCPATSVKAFPFAFPSLSPTVLPS